MAKQILLPKPTLRELREKFGVRNVVLDRALKFERNSDRDRQMRAEALLCGGIIHPGPVGRSTCSPNQEMQLKEKRGCIRETEDETLFMCFGTNVEVIYDIRHAETTLRIDGMTAGIFADQTAGLWTNICYSLRQADTWAEPIERSSKKLMEEIWRITGQSSERFCAAGI